MLFIFPYSFYLERPQMQVGDMPWTYGFVIYGLNYKSMLAYGRMDILFVALTDLATKRRSSGVYLSAVDSDTIIITLLTDYHL